MSIQEFDSDNASLVIILMFLSILFTLAIVQCQKEPILPITTKDIQTRNTVFHRNTTGYTKVDIMV
jgi:hypothetical protein